ncbi:MAG: 6,7-dimethyl-8-ribityllumazine synthase [Candidatus Kerfeldbacteria bacterium]|nr:6,7-dimethyl-8-ribityllumazine synthase [Candidatus Kerfeldbacteria bacterium]
MKRLALLTTTINPETIAEMVAAAGAEINLHGAELIVTSKTLGCLDMPIIAKQLLERTDVDGLVLLGAVAKGDTQHDELVVNTMTQAIVQLSLQYNKPVGFGVIGPGATKEQFKNRTVEYATRAVQAVVQNLNVLNQ